MSRKARKPLLESFNPLFVILICTAITLVALIGLESISPFFSSRKWTWLVYLAGSIMVFLSYWAKARKRRLSDESVGGSDSASVENTKDATQDLGKVRKRVRALKARKGEDSDG